MPPYPASASRWLNVFKGVERPRFRVFCFPHACAGASVFRDWPRHFAADAELCAVQLPGRENRILDPVPDRLDDLVSPLIAAIRPLAGTPFVLFGHSLGAIIAYEVARGLDAIESPPRLLGVSGCRPPHVPLERKPLHGLPDAELKRAIGDMGGTSPEVLAHDELMDFLLPTIRADFRLAECYLQEAGLRVGCPIHAFAGTADPAASPEKMAGWSMAAGGSFICTALDGGHFFVKDHVERIAAALAAPFQRRESGTGSDDH